jgi:hypothetical protein
LLAVIGPPPANVVIQRWRWDPEKGEHFLEVHPPPPPPEEDANPVPDKLHES